MSHKMQYSLFFFSPCKCSARALYTSDKPVLVRYDFISVSDCCTWNFVPALGKNELSVTSKYSEFKSA